MDWAAVSLTAQLATLTSLILFFAGVPCAYWLSRTAWRGRFLIEAVVALPLVLPPTVVGFYLLLALGPSSVVGSTYESLTSRLPGFSSGR
jgi:molybdate transport system permease protein